jgi:hypothetical protein
MRDFNNSKRQRRHSRAGLLWALGFFLCGQVTFLLTVSQLRPELRNPEYGLRLRKLHARLAEHAVRQPKMLVMGSSRVAVGFRPEVLRKRGRESFSDFGKRLPTPFSEPVVFNYGVFGSGPLLQLMCLHRLLSDGIKPESILLEIWPPMWCMEPTALENLRQGQPTPFNLPWMRWQDLRLLERYRVMTPSVYQRWYKLQLIPLSSYRFSFLSQYAPSWSDRVRREEMTWRGLHDLGWVKAADYQRTADKEALKNLRVYVRHMFLPMLTSLCLNDVSRQATREFLSLCQQQGIHVELLLMPEDSEFRSWYSKQALAITDGFVGELSREFKIPVIDARTWSSDDDFADGAHLTYDGAAAFTIRLDREVIRPLLEENALVARSTKHQ